MLNWTNWKGEKTPLWWNLLLTWTCDMTLTLKKMIISCHVYSVKFSWNGVNFICYRWDTSIFFHRYACTFLLMIVIILCIMWVYFSCSSLSLSHLFLTLSFSSVFFSLSFVSVVFTVRAHLNLSLTKLFKTSKFNSN